MKNNKSLSRLDTMKNQALILSSFNRSIANKRHININISQGLKDLIKCPAHEIKNYLKQTTKPKEDLSINQSRRNSNNEIKSKILKDINQIILDSRRKSCQYMPGLTGGKINMK